MGERYARLTKAEWSAVVGAFTDADSIDEDRCEGSAEWSVAARRDAAARARAYRKIRDALTTPGIRGDGSRRHEEAQHGE